MRSHPHVIPALKQELYDAQLWTGRAVVIAFAAISGITIVAFTWLTEYATAQFFHVQRLHWWAPLLWTPASTMAIVWLTMRFAPGAAGSGIPQVTAALEPRAHGALRQWFVSFRLSVAKIALTTWAGVPAGIFAPSLAIGGALGNDIA